MADGDFLFTLLQTDMSRFNIANARELIARRLRVGLAQVTVWPDPDNHMQICVRIAQTRPSETLPPAHEHV